MTSKIKEKVKTIALEEGFDAIAITSTKVEKNISNHLNDFLNKNYQGDMNWLLETREQRIDPLKIMKTAKSIITLGTNYGPYINPMENLSISKYGVISAYAQTSKDYHTVIKKALKRAARRISSALNTDLKIFVDTAPVMEKPLAAQSGLGWQGKHTNLVSQSFGSWLFLSEIFVAIEIEPDLPAADHCGSCTACLDACPTKAFPQPYQLDSNKCISYLTIEHQGHIKSDLMEGMGNHIFGCDDCLSVCPWNKFSKPTDNPQLQPRIELTKPKLKDLVKLTDQEFRTIFAGSPIKRTGRNRFIRNVLIAIGNTSDKSLLPIIKHLTCDSSPIVADAAKWASEKIKRKL